MFKLFSKAFNQKVQAVQKFSNKDFAEAAVGAAILIAAADGTIEESELTSLSAIISSMDQFANFQGQINQMVEKFANKIRVSPLLGKNEIMREVRDCKGSVQEIEDILAIAVTVAGADGEFEQAEIDVLKKLASELGLPMSKLVEFGVPA